MHEFIYLPLLGQIEILGHGYGGFFIGFCIVRRNNEEAALVEHVDPVGCTIVATNALLTGST